MILTLGFSPCPNDTFIFDALVNGKIDTGGISFDVVLEDVQTLNLWAIEGKLDISKISYGVLPLVLPQYTVLNSGGALGKGVGPLLITKDQSMTAESVNNATIAIPGINTTAHLLFSMAFPSAKNKSFHIFHEIEELVVSRQVDAGVIIHENRFTYQQKGLHKIMDLGDYWEQQTEAPIPLGGIVAHHRIIDTIALEVNDMIRKSVEYAFAHYPEVSNYVRAHAQEMSEDVMRQHIDLYVNEFSIDLGIPGKQAVSKLIHIAQPDFVNKATSPIFLSDR